MERDDKTADEAASTAAEKLLRSYWARAKCAVLGKMARRAAVVAVGDGTVPNKVATLPAREADAALIGATLLEGTVPCAAGARRRNDARHHLGSVQARVQPRVPDADGVAQEYNL